MSFADVAIPYQRSHDPDDNSQLLLISSLRFNVGLKDFQTYSSNSAGTWTSVHYYLFIPLHSGGKVKGTNLFFLKDVYSEVWKILLAAIICLNQDPLGGKPTIELLWPLNK